MNKAEIKELKDRMEHLEENLSNRTLMFFSQRDKIEKLEEDLANVKRLFKELKQLEARASSNAFLRSHAIATSVKTLFYLIIANLICNSCFFIYHFILGGR